MTARIAALAALAALVLLVGAAPAPAADGPPTELWSEYPLAPPAAAPLTPPVRGEGGPKGVAGVIVPEGGDGSAPAPWLVITSLLTVAALIAVVVGRRLARPGSGRLADPSVLEAPVTESFETCVIELVAGPESSRFVAELEERGKRRTLATSPSFPRSDAGRHQLGTMGWRAWHVLIDRLEADGWELVPRWGALEGEPITFEEARAAQLVRAGPHASSHGANEPFRRARVG